MKETFLSAVVAGMVIVCAQGADPAPAVQKFDRRYELGSGGLIGNWLVLETLPGILPAEKNRLAAVGGETAISPYAGETVTLPAGGTNANLALTWKMAEVQNPEIPWTLIKSKGLYLFLDAKGVAITNAIAYAYCNLESAEDQTLSLAFTGGEPIRIWFNGENVPRAWRAYQRCDWTPSSRPVPVTLKKGLNRLLVRTENTTEDEFLSVRLVKESGGVPTNVKVLIKDILEGPSFGKRLPGQNWQALIAEIPPVPPSVDEEFFGARLGRTMTLLETGGQTKRPVRILFYGQSITCQGWAWQLVRRLRERYPDTEIQPENWAIGGWGIDKLNRTIKHDVLRGRPDLVVLHAYQGGSWEWERIIQKIRRETSAEIMIRTAHIAAYEIEHPQPDVDSETLMLRRLARQYGCELVEGRKEWLSFLRANAVDPKELRSDAIHLNHKGCVLMAQLYERHFRVHPAAQPWFRTVRRYEAMRPLADRREDEIQLLGNGWNDRLVNCALSTGTNDSLKLKFYGNRVDLVMPAHGGSAKVFIDGKAPSELNLLFGTRPGRSGTVPADLMTYYTGPDMLAESWELKFTHVSGDHNKYRWTLTGSKTGPDGEGDNSTLFVSKSGRITIRPEDFLFNGQGVDREKKELVPVEGECSLKWTIPPSPYKDEVQGIPMRPDEAKQVHNSRYDVFYRYITIADGLPQGEHELTLIPTKPNQFSIDAVEVHRPPLWK